MSNKIFSIAKYISISSSILLGYITFGLIYMGFENKKGYIESSVLKMTKSELIIEFCFVVWNCIIIVLALYWLKKLYKYFSNKK